MNNYKVGSKVVCTNTTSKKIKEGEVYTISWCYGAGLIVLEGVDGSWSESNFELIQDESIDMKGGFKVGDKVVRIVGDFGFIREGDVCSVSGLRGDGQLEFDGDDTRYYNPRNFELYVENGTTEILTPLQVAEAILNGEELQVEYTSNVWKEFDNRNITIPFIEIHRFRLKPKTMIINGVEVPAPLNNSRITEQVWGVKFSDVKPYCIQGKYSNEESYYWATKEDAQQVLDAMLIPFNQL